MPQITIRLVSDPKTGTKRILIEMRGDADALPHEYEEMHRAVVDKLIESGLVPAAQRCRVEVVRVGE